jgi:hypothetical protein
MDDGHTPGSPPVPQADFPCGGTVGSEHPLKFHTRIQLRSTAPAAVQFTTRIRSLKARGHDNGSHLDFKNLLTLPEFHGAKRAGFPAQPAVLAVEPKAAGPVYSGQVGPYTWIWDVDRLPLIKALVVIVAHNDRANLDAAPASEACVGIHKSRRPQHLGCEIAEIAKNLQQLRRSERRDVFRVQNLVQQGIENARSAFHAGRELLVPHSLAAQGRRFLHEMDSPSGLGQQLGSAETGDSGPHDEDVGVALHTPRLQGLVHEHPCHGSVEDLLNAPGGCAPIRADPHPLLPDVGHLKKVWIEAGLEEHFPEAALMLCGRAGGDDHM